MKVIAVLSIALILISSGVNSEAENTKDKQDTVTTVAPPAPTIDLKDSDICKQCKCTEKKINCYDANIKTFFNKDQWKDVTSLKPEEINLGDNSFAEVTPFAELPVKVLILSHSNIETIENASFKDLQSMKTLDLSHNKLTSAKLSPHAFEGRYAPEAYEPLSEMRTLDLSFNDLHSLNQDLFEHLPELESLDLSGNPLQTIDTVTIIAISSLPMLKVLRLRSCGITALPDKFLHSPRYLQRLDISDNKLTAVPKELEETKSLEYLNLNENPIVKIENDDEDYRGFPRLRKLQELHMCNMAELRSIGPGALSGLENVAKLHISFNPKLQHIDPKALARPDDIGETYIWPMVKELDLQNNNLAEIDSRLISRWDLLQKVNISNNPFLCDCTTQWMVDVLVPIVDAKGKNSSEEMKCQEPIEMRGYTMKHLHDIHRTMRCLDKYGNRPEKDGAILLGALIGVLLSLPIMLGVTLLWRHGYLARCGLRGPVDVSRAFYRRAPAEDFS